MNDLISLVSNCDIQGLQDILEKSNADILQLRDSKDSTLLHLSALRNSLPMTELLIHHVKSSVSTEQWVQSENAEGFTCMMYAIFNGNLRLVQLLIENGGDLSIQTKLGLGPMHLAAQGNRLEILAYLREEGWDINGLDHKGSTPLHWSAFMSSEVAVGYLLEAGARLDIKDCYGQTALHLASHAGNAHIVRQLLIYGADIKALDLQGRSPLDVAVQNPHLLSILKSPNIMHFCGFRAPNRPIRQKRALLCVFVLMISLGVTLNVLFILPLSLWYYVIVFIQVFLLVLVCNLSPRYIENNDWTVLGLCQKFDSSKICVICVVPQEENTIHCQICQRCVLKFDHHCMWVNNCIGERNIGVFYGFLLATLTLLGASFSLSTYYCLYMAESFIEIPELLYKMLAFCIALMSLCFFIPLFLLIRRQTINTFKMLLSNYRIDRSNSIQDPLRTSLLN